ncbi:hypothetical protein G9A89_013782 [Geosiphon pyriformis]|nr:hypothetical protein G9A89_013782 [Geosiphon pyriformis]
MLFQILPKQIVSVGLKSLRIAFQNRQTRKVIYNWHQNALGSSGVLISQEAFKSFEKQPQIDYSSLSSQAAKFCFSDFLLYPNHFTEYEQNLLVTQSKKKLDRLLGKTLSYQNGHFDGVIRGYRECQVSDWIVTGDDVTSEISELLKEKVYEFIPRVCSTINKWSSVHILDLAEWGGIKPHVDNLEYSGAVIVGVCLISPAVMIFRSVDQSNVAFSALLEPGCLYLQNHVFKFKISNQNEAYYWFFEVVEVL